MTRDANTYLQFARDVDLGPGSSILIITSAIYRPVQHMDAVRVLGPFGATVETAGVVSKIRATYHAPSAYLQEIRSGIRSAKALLEAAGTNRIGKN